MRQHGLTGRTACQKTCILHPRSEISDMARRQIHPVPAGKRLILCHHIAIILPSHCHYITITWQSHGKQKGDQDDKYYSSPHFAISDAVCMGIFKPRECDSHHLNSIAGWTPLFQTPKSPTCLSSSCWYLLGLKVSTSMEPYLNNRSGVHTSHSSHDSRCR